MQKLCVETRLSFKGRSGNQKARSPGPAGANADAGVFPHAASRLLVSQQTKTCTYVHQKIRITEMYFFNYGKLEEALMYIGSEKRSRTQGV